MINLNIIMQSFKLSPCIVQDNDTIRISVTTLPEEQKQAISFVAKKMKKVHPFFAVPISDKTEKLLIVVRKKSFSQKDPIIASTVIKRDQIPTKINDHTNTEMKTINLFEPLQQADKDDSPTTKRKKVGKIKLQFILTKEINCQKSTIKFQIGKKKILHGYAKIDSLLDENGEDNFLPDPITN